MCATAMVSADLSRPRRGGELALPGQGAQGQQTWGSSAWVEGDPEERAKERAKKIKINHHNMGFYMLNSPV